jgi:hypothetical protein
MSNFDTKQLNARLSDQAYTNWTQQDVDNGTVAYTDDNGQDWVVYAVSGDTDSDTGFYGVAYRSVWFRHI